MDYSDRFHPTEENDFEELDIHGKPSYMLQNLKSLDKRFHKFKKTILVETDNGDHVVPRKVVIEYYSSGPSGTLIRNGQTGVYTKDIVGSKQEDLYFKVTMSDGNTLTVFYDSPDQYERHQREKLSQDLKEKWMKKRLLYEKNQKNK